MNDDELTQLHPNYKTVLRISAAIFTIPFIIGAVVLEFMGISWTGVFIVPVLIIALVLILRLPMRRYAARGYSTTNERLRVVRGIWWRGDTVVPYGRVQHIDVDRHHRPRLARPALSRRIAWSASQTGYPSRWQLSQLFQPTQLSFR